MDGIRKVLVLAPPTLTGPKWLETTFASLDKGDKFRLIDLDDNGEIAEGYEDGTNVYLANAASECPEDVVASIDAVLFGTINEEGDIAIKESDSE